MLKFRRGLTVAVLTGMTLAAAGAPGHAQETTNTLGPPQLKDFRLPGERQAAPREQPVAPAPPPAPVPAPAPAARTPAPAQQTPAPRPAEDRPRPAEAAPRTGATEREAPPQVPSQPQEVFQLPQGPAEAARPPAASVPASEAAPVPPAPQSAPQQPGEGRPLYHYAVPAVALLGIGGFLFMRRRRRSAALDEAMAAAALIDNPPPPPRPEPVPRPWLELELKAERAASTSDEASVDFEMVIRNTGKSPARNIRINARMFNAGREQDKEIGAFFKTKGEGRKTHVIPELPAGERGLIQGSVTMPRDEMKALQVNNQLLFIPVVGVNLVYDWGSGRTGQTSKSYVIGRELGEESDKMGAFRLDLGPRVYRTVGQRQHNLAKRV
jgi:MYXO-CTERM domain-containing protein